MQKFKLTDLEEDKYIESVKSILDALSLNKDDFYEGAYSAAPLGDLLFENKLAPLTNAINQAIFRSSFQQIIEAFISGGTFESYLTVFQQIFGEDVEVTFTVPAPGKLNIDIEAEGVELSDFVARRIVNNMYVFDEIIDYEDDNIVFQTIKGFESQYELEQMLFEMVPGGIFTQITLTLGA